MAPLNSRRSLANAASSGESGLPCCLGERGGHVHDQVGRTNTYRLNTDHLATEPLIVLSQLSPTFLKRLEKHLDGWPTTLRYAAVFGSAATGQMKLDSESTCS